MDFTLRAFIQAVLSEAAMDASAAGKSGLGLLTSDAGSRPTLVLFDTKTALKGLKALQASRATESEIEDALEQSIVGYIQLKKSVAPTLGAWCVAASAAQKGYGPLMYDIAMSIFGKITADRGTVSDSAKKVWQYYFSNRSDVNKALLDDIDDPKTPPKNDDAYLHSTNDEAPEENPLNYVYSGAKVDTARLNANTDRFLGVATKKLGYDGSTLNYSLRSVGALFFNENV